MSTPSFGVPADFNYDQLLVDHLEQVFNERQADRRLAALAKLYNDDAMVIDPDGTKTGHHAISQLVGDLQARFPSDFSFRAAGRGIGLSGVCYLPWKLGPPKGPAAVSGVDVAYVRNGRIHEVYVLIDPAE